MASNVDPGGSFSFYLELDSVLSGSFREVTGMGSEHEVIEHKESGPKGEFVVHKVPGRMKWGDVTLKRGITKSMDIWDWRQKVEEGKVGDARRNGSIIMYAQGTQDPIARWEFVNAWPSKVTGPSFNAQSNEIGIEELVIVHEGLKRVKP
jgi:phage tail-like protein